MGVPTGRAAVVRKALRSFWKNCHTPPFVLELAGEVVSLCDHWRERYYPPLFSTLNKPWYNIGSIFALLCCLAADKV